MKCHFCQTDGVFVACELLAPPPPVQGLPGLKLVTCDFHQHHCAFFMCAACWGSGFHLCRNEHRWWHTRLSKFDLTALEEKKRDHWRFRYATEDAPFPSVCRVQKAQAAFCPSCSLYRPGAVGEECGNFTCRTLLVGSGCPACLPLNLPAHDGVQQPCLDEAQAAREDQQDVAIGQHALATTVIDDLAPFRKLDVQYADESDYQYTAGDKPPPGRCQVFRVNRPPVQWGAGPGELSEVTQDASKWPEFVGTNLQFEHEHQRIDGVRVLLPRAAFAGGSFPCRKAAIRRKARESSKMRVTTRGALKKASADVTIPSAAAVYADAVLYQPKTGALYGLSDSQREGLYTLMGAPVDVAGILIQLPPRGGGGAGGALGRANDLGSSGMKHALVTARAQAPDVQWSRFERLKNDVTDPRKSGTVDTILKPPLDPATSYVPLRLIPGTSLALWAHVPEPERRRQRPREDRALELFREREENGTRHQLALAAIAFSRALALVDDGDRVRALAHNTVQGFLSANLPTLERSVEALANAGPFLQAVHQGRQSASEEDLRAAALVVLRALRQKVNEELSTVGLAQAALTAFQAVSLDAVRNDLATGRKHVELAKQHHARAFGDASVAEPELLAKIQARLDLKGDPKDQHGAAYKDWWGDELWIAPGLDDGSWDPGEVEEDPKIPTELVGKATESSRPDYWPERPPHTAEYWNWNGRPLAIARDVERTWQLLTGAALERRNYKDSGLHVMRPHVDARKESDRQQDTFFDGVSATEVALGLTNKLAGSEFLSLPPDFNAKRPNPWYEWSHLIGDGEGGSIHRANIVSSTRANNTEMLIIETVLQQLYDQVTKAGLEFVLRVQVSTFGRLTDLEAASSFHRRVRHIHYHTHVGNWMRYTVWVRPGRSFAPPSTVPEPAPDYPASALVLDHILDCLRPRISKAQVRVMDFQVRFLLARTLRARYGVVLEDKAEDALSLPELGHEGGKGSLDLKPYAHAAALQTSLGRRLERLANAGGGDCLFLAFRQGLELLPPLTRQAALTRAGLPTAALPTALDIRQRAVAHLAFVLGYPGPHPPFAGSDQFGPMGDPRAGHGAMIEFLTTYREDYARVWRGYDDWDLYLALMQTAGWWGDMIMCVTLSHLFGVQIDVHRGHHGIQPILAHDLVPAPVVRLLNAAGVHFEALREVDA